MRLKFGRTDLELLLVVVLWGFNLTVVKLALREVDPMAFNIVRFACASAALLAVTWAVERSVCVPRADLGRVLLLGLIGHALYQLCFILGLARTTASSVALIFGSTPIVVAILSRLAGHERFGVTTTAGALLAFYGVFLIVTGKPEGLADTGHALAGDILALGAVVCWSCYTVLAAPLLKRHSPLKITALSLSYGMIMMAPASVPALLRQSWSAVSPLTWASLGYSALFALVIPTVLWYRSVQRVGNVRTALYSNLVPVFGTLFSVWLIGDQLTAGIGLGGACVLAGIVISRLKHGSARVPES